MIISNHYDIRTGVKVELDSHVGLHLYSENKHHHSVARATEAWTEAVQRTQSTFGAGLHFTG